MTDALTEDRSKTDSTDETRGGPLNVATFDGVRGFVVLFIVLIHCSIITGWFPHQEFLLALRRSSMASIEFLFAISGFVLFLPVAARGSFGSVRSFAIRRVGRIVPGYYLSVLLALLFTFFIDLGIGLTGFQSVHKSLGMVLAHFAFLQLELYPGQVGFAVNPILWTVSLIVIFYALLPVVAGRYLRHPIVGLILAMIACSAWRLTTKDSNHLFLQFPAYLTALGLGMSGAVAYVWLHRRIGRTRLRPWAPPVFALAAAALVAVLYFDGRGVVRGEHSFWAEPIGFSIAIPALFLTLVLSSAFAAGWLQWPFANPASRWLGDVSYGVFLYHALLAQLALKGLPGLYDKRTPVAMLQMSAIVVPSSLIVAWINLELLERPLRARARRIARRFEGRPEATPPEGMPVPALAGKHA